MELIAIRHCGNGWFNPVQMGIGQLCGEKIHERAMSVINRGTASESGFLKPANPGKLQWERSRGW